jgi:hypothetical protein
MYSLCGYCRSCATSACFCAVHAGLSSQVYQKRSVFVAFVEGGVLCSFFDHAGKELRGAACPLTRLAIVVFTAPGQASWCVVTCAAGQASGCPTPVVAQLVVI